MVFLELWDSSLNINKRLFLYCNWRIDELPIIDELFSGKAVVVVNGLIVLDVVIWIVVTLDISFGAVVDDEDFV